MSGDETIYWTWIDEHGELQDAEFDTEQEAFDFAENEFNESFDSRGTQYQDIVLISFCYDDDTGEKKILSREKTKIEAENYGSDFDQHNTYY